MKTLHLTAVNPDRRVIAMRAVKAALTAAGMESAEAFHVAESAVFAVLRGNGPVALVEVQPGSSVREADVQAAHDAFMAAVGDTGAATVVGDLADTEAPLPAAEAAPEAPPTQDRVEAIFAQDVPPDFNPPAPARRAAIVLLLMHSGNVQTAWIHAKMMARATGDLDLWGGVGHTLADAVGVQQKAP